MTPGVGLAQWNATGTLARELAPYLEYVRRGWRVIIATYDRPGAVPPLPDGIEVFHCWRRRLQFLAPWFMRRAIRSADVVKTNQSVGAWWYVLAARLNRRPILLRCGWLPGNYRETKGGLTWRLRIYRLFEGWAFRHADQCLTATHADREWAIEHYRVAPERVHLRPNFVDIDLFRPLQIEPIARSVVFVGRLDAVKRLDLLIDACVAAGASQLTLVGEGPEQDSLKNVAAARGLPLHCLGRKAQQELPAVLQKSSVFALVSKVEGHPKALLEAMSCGMACVGARAPGISNAIQDGVDGLLCEATPASVGAVLRRLFDEPELRTRLGDAARTRVAADLSFAAVMDREIALAQSMIDQRAADFQTLGNAGGHVNPT